MIIILILDKILARHTANAMIMALNNKERCTGDKARKLTQPLAQLKELIRTVQGASDNQCTPANWLSVPPQYTALQAKKEKEKLTKKKHKEEEKKKQRERRRIKNLRIEITISTR